MYDATASWTTIVLYRYNYFNETQTITASNRCLLSDYVFRTRIISILFAVLCGTSSEEYTYSTVPVVFFCSFSLYARCLDFQSTRWKIIYIILNEKKYVSHVHRAVSENELIIIFDSASITARARAR